MINKIKNTKYYKTILFFIIEGIYLILIDSFNQYLIIRSFNLSDYLTKTTILFNIIWISIILIILYVLKPKIRKIITIVLNALLLIFSIANYFLNSYFSSIFSWKDLALSRDGASFISSIFKFINLKLILFTLLTVILTIIIAKIKIKKIY